MTRFRSLQRDQQGFTLVELLVVMFVLSIVLTMALRALVSVQRNSFASQERLQNLDEGRVLMATLTKDLRTAATLATQPAITPAFVVAEDRKAVFYANLNTSTGPKKVTIEVDAQSRLVETTVNPTANTSPPYNPPYFYTSAPEVRIVGRFVTNSAAQPIFTYYGEVEDDPLTPEIETVEELDTPVSAADLETIREVEIALTIKKDTKLPIQATTLVSRVRMPNLYYDPNTGG